MNVLPIETKLRVLAALVEGTSIRGVERLTGVHRDTVMRLGVAAGNACARLHDTLIRDVRAALIECDEIWTYVGKKQKRVTDSDPRERGDQYVFTALDPVSKLLISYRVGKRTAPTTLAFIEDLRARVLGRPQIATDAMSAYRDAIDWVFGRNVDYVQVEKRYASGDPTPEASRRYSPTTVIGVEKTVIEGTPDLDLATTSRVERSNLTWRMSMRRFTRLTNGFSKKLENLEAAFALQAAYYNFCRVHETTRVTPAMQAGITDHVWSLGELLATATALPTDVPPVVPPPPPAPTGLSAGQAKGVPWGVGSRGRAHGLRIIQGRRR